MSKSIEQLGTDLTSRVFCETCGHSEFIHSDNGNRRCLYAYCECSRFIVGATTDLSAQVPPP